MKSCLEFRSHLRDALEGHLDQAPLAWHEHLGSCPACRDLFEAEEALDELLACLPEPSLPIALTQRVLRRLAADVALDRTLDSALDVVAPAGLAERVLAGVRERRATLDELLELLPEPRVPADLSARVLAGLQPERSQGRPRLVPRRVSWWRPAAVAAAAVVALTVWRAWSPERDSLRPIDPQRVASNDPPAEVVDPILTPDPELLAELDLLEDWDLLVPQDPDLLLGSLSESETELLLLDRTTSSTTPASDEAGG